MAYSNVLYLDLLAPALIAFIAGLVTHSFIIGVNVSDWWRGRSVTPVDYILTSLAILRICAPSAVTLEFFLGRLFSPVTRIIMFMSYLFFTYANIWLTSLLSIVLCLKISNLHTRLFLYLRRMILHRTGCLIVAFLLISVVNCLMDFTTLSMEDTGHVTPNTTINNLFINCGYIHSILNYIIADFFPLIFCCISSVLLFVSMYHHTTRMKMSSNLSINLETYYSAMRFIFLTFLYNTVYSAGHLLCALYYYFNCVNIQWLHIVLEFLSVLHSSYLIYRTAKLRNQMSKVLQNVMDFLLHI